MTVILFSLQYVTQWQRRKWISKHGFNVSDSNQSLISHFVVFNLFQKNSSTVIPDNPSLLAVDQVVNIGIQTKLILRGGRQSGTCSKLIWSSLEQNLYCLSNSYGFGVSAATVMISISAK